MLCSCLTYNCAGITKQDIYYGVISFDTRDKVVEGVAVTYGPGLVGSLLIGLSFAKAISYSLRIPLIGINHIEGHIFADFLEHPNISPPFVCLVISGGHSNLVYVSGRGDYELMGQTRDDAAGEAFDKVAKVLNLGYPGGPAIDRVSPRGWRRGVLISPSVV